jgi:chemotaxis response regulator CheB
VLDKSGETSPGVPVVIYSSATNDLSEAMIKELNAGALPIPPAENKKTSASDTKPAPK